MSVSITKSSSLSPVTRPTDIPATGRLIGTPAAISESVLPQILACEVEPLELNISDTSLIAYGNSSSLGITGRSALSARAPCPISRLPGPLDVFASPVEKPGIL